MPERNLSNDAGSGPAEHVYGASVQGRPLIAKTYGSTGPLTMLLFTFHGDEREVLPVGLRLEHELGTNAGLYEDRRVLLVLQVNPDGWILETRQNANAVDLNRNFPVAWEPGELGSDYFPGPSPLSEPESRALADLIEVTRPDKIVTIHQPFDWLDPDGPQSVPLAKAMRDASGMRLPDRAMKPTPGSFGKYCDSKGITIVTLEMPEVDANRLEEYWTVTRAALLAAIKF